MSTSPRRRPAPPCVADDLYDQPGHLIRRAHQIAQGLFTERVGDHVTSAQYAILRMVQEAPGIDQVGLARRTGLDTSTAALTAARLESRGLLTRTAVEGNRRQLQLVLTREGEALLASMVQGVHEIGKRMLAGLDADEQQTFIRLLRKFVHLNNDQSRAPLQVAAPEDPPAPAAAVKPRAGRAAAAKPKAPAKSKKPTKRQA